MFNNAKLFNHDVSSWDISNVGNAAFMFSNATSFNQKLCNWGDTFPYGNDSDEDIFSGSGCKHELTPQADQKEPFCASKCL